MIRDIKKTEELLEGLKEEHISVENIDKYLQQQGVLVDVHVGRLRNKVDISPNMFGVDTEKSEDLTTFFKDYVNTGKMCFIPMKYEKKFQSIETSLRSKKSTMSLGYDNKYMPIETYKEYKEYVELKKKEYFSLRDEILDLWDNLIDNFKFTVDISLREMNALNSNLLKKQIFSKIPSKDKYGSSFYIETSLKAFPIMNNLDLLDDSIEEELKESMKKDSIKSVYEILSNILSDAFESVNKVLTFYNKKGTLTDKQLKVLILLKPRIASKNILKNVLINEIIKDLSEINLLVDDDDIAERCERVLARIYGFAAEIEVDMYLDLSKSALSVDELTSIYDAVS